MGLILQILGIVFVAIVLAVVLAFVVLRAKLRRFAAEMGSSLEDLQYADVPTRLHLRRRDTVAWKDDEAAGRLAAALHALGFEDGGLWEPEEMAYLRLQALVQPRESVYAVVYEHDKAGVWIDLVSRYADGTSVTYSTASQGGQLDQRPGHSVTRHPGLEPAALYEKLLAERPQRPLEPVSAEAFKPAFERAYADEIDWRNSRGGPSDDELRAIAAASGSELSDEELELLREQTRATAFAGLEESLRERFLEQTTLPAAEWEEIRERVVIVHDRMTRAMVASAFYDWTESDEYDDEDEDDEEDTDEDPDRPVPDGTPREAFAALNETLPPDRRFRKLGEVTGPVDADVYCAPEGEE